MPFETFFLGRLKVKVTGVKERSKWSNTSSPERNTMVTQF